MFSLPLPPDGAMAERSIGARIKKLRQDKGLTQKALAEPGYTHAYISTIEAGKRQPSAEALKHFAERLGVTPQELATGRTPDLEPQLELLAADARRLMSTGQRIEAETLLQQLEAEAKEHLLPRFIARAAELRGISTESSGQRVEAAQHFERAIELLREEPAYLRAVSTAGLARCAHGAGEPHQAIYLLESLREEMHREGLEEPAAVVRVNATLVLPYHATGARSKAAEAAKTALSLATHVKDPSTLATMHMNLGRVHLDRGEHAEAEAAIRRAQELLREADLQTELGLAHVALGIVASRHGRISEALAELKSAEGILEATRSIIELANCRAELGRVHRLSGDTTLAESTLGKAIGALPTDDARVLPWVLRELAMTHLEQEPETAERDARRAIDLYEEQDVLELAVTYRVLGDALSAQGRREDAEKAYREGLQLVESTI